MLKHLSPKCPVCGKELLSLAFDKRAHINGNRGEQVTYACGARIAYIPNFHGHSFAIQTVHPCESSPQLIQSEIVVETRSIVTHYHDLDPIKDLKKLALPYTQFSYEGENNKKVVSFSTITVGNLLKFNPLTRGGVDILDNDPIKEKIILTSES